MSIEAEKPAAGDDGARREAGLLARRSAFNFVGLAVANGLQFLMLLVIAYALGQDATGIFLLGFAALRLLSTVAGVGLDVTVIRYVAMHRARGEMPEARAAVRLATAVATAVAVAIAAIVFVAAPLAAEAFASPRFESELEHVLRVMILALPFMVVQMVLIGATRGTGAMRAYVLVDQIVDGAVRFGAIAVALALGYGLEGTAWAFTIASVVIAAASVAAARPVVLGAVERRAGQLRELLGFTSYQWGAVVASVGLLWASTLLLGLWRPEDDVAVYGIASRTVLAGMIFILPIGIAFQPVITRLYTAGDRARLRQMYSFATKWATLAGVPPLLFLALYATPVITALYEPGYERGAWVLALLALAQTVNAATGPCGHLVTMVGRSDLVFVNSLAALVLNLVLSVALIPPFGLVGAGLAWAVSIVAWNFYRLFQAWQVLRIHPFHGWPARAAVALAVFAFTAGAARLALDGEPALLAIVAGAAVATAAYVPTLVGLRLLSRPPGLSAVPALQARRAGR
jgi:O-antigen/teichoic acid export membrane protein